MIKNKLYEILTSDDVEKSIRENEDFIFDVIPELKFSYRFDQKHPHHHLDVWEHTLYALSLSENNYIVRLSLLLHDIGKPFCYTEGEVRHFDGHPLVSSILSVNILSRLGFKKEIINEVEYLVKFHDTPITKNDIDNNYELSYKRYLVQTCDALAHHPDHLEKRKKYLVKTKEKFERVI